MVRLTAFAAVVAGLMGLTAVAHADESFTWTATGNGNWSSGLNWGGTAPSASDGEVNLIFPESGCTAITTHTECPTTTDDVSSLTVGTLQMADVVDWSASSLGPPSPGGGSYSITGSDPVTLDSGITVETTTLGSGTAEVSYGLTDLGLPIVLGGPNTWSIGSDVSFDVNGSVSGDYALSITGGSDDLLELGKSVEVGPLTLTSVAVQPPVGESVGLNGTDAQPVTLDMSSLGSFGTPPATGPLTVENESVLGVGGGTPLQVNGDLGFDASSTLDGELLASGSDPEVIATGAVDLDDAKLVLDDDGCAAPGSESTLVEAQGGIEGTFSDAAGPITNGEVVEPRDACPSDASDPIEINYTGNTVTATLDPPPSTPPATGSAGAPGTAGGATPAAVSPPPAPPSVDIANVQVNSRRHRARVVFTATGSETAFECALTKARGKHHRFASPSFAPCSSPQAYSSLGKGKYELWVEASGPGGTGAPVARQFRIS